MASFWLFSLKLQNSTFYKLFYFTGQLGHEVLKDVGLSQHLVALGQRPF